MALAASCTNKGQTASGADSDSLAVDSLDSLVAEVRDTTPKPMFLYYFDPANMQVVYWTEGKKVDREWFEKNNMLDYYEGALRTWERFDAYRRNATGYTLMLLDGGKSVAIRCVGEQLTNPDGEDLYPGELHTRTTIPSPGMKYALVDPKQAPHNEYFAQFYIIVHDSSRPSMPASPCPKPSSNSSKNNTA